jgi:hypothetical protein
MHRAFLPAARAGSAPADHCAEQIVAVAEHIGGYGNGVADAPLCGIAAVVDCRCWILNDDPRRSRRVPTRSTRARRPRSGP